MFPYLSFIKIYCSKTKTEVCKGDIITLQASGLDSNFFWSNAVGDTLSKSESLKVLINSDTTIYLISSFLQDSVMLKMVDRPTRTIESSALLCEKTEIVLDVSQQKGNFLWFDGTTSLIKIIQTPGNYWVKTLIATCFRYDTIKVESCPYSFYIPNSFSPNNDGINDFFVPVGVQILNFSINIYDAWGKLVFSSNQIDRGWNGEGMSIGVYFYECKFEDVLGNYHQLVGNITLIR